MLVPTVTVQPRKASGPGALDGFAIHCSEHGEVYASSLETLARQGAVAHEKFHADLAEAMTYRHPKPRRR